MTQKMWDIWIEGYITTGMEGNAAKATYDGVWQGETFKDACEVWAESKGGDKRFFDPRDLSFWGCRLFDNEEDARKSFG